MLTGLHLLLTYKCIYECDHCFVYSSPYAEGTFTIKQIQNVIDEAVKIETIEWIYFEGGEPFLFYPVMLEGIKIASAKGFKTGIVTNAYFASNDDDAVSWLKPLAELGISDLSISDDKFHSNDITDSPAKRALKAARKLCIPAGTICISEPKIEISSGSKHQKGKPVVGGDVMFKGRAADKLVKDLPLTPWDEFTKCPYEELISPERVHLDSYGNVHICQGISMGNMWETPLSKLVKTYNAESHPICKTLSKEGPAGLSKEFNFKPESGYVDACHFCYSIRKSLLDKFPQYLTPRQVYGVS